MRLAILAAVPLLAAALAACESEAERQADAAEDRLERAADASADAAGNAVAALGLTERQLLEADLVAADGTELGDVAQIRRGLDGEVEGLLIEIEDSDPDRFVAIPLTGLTIRGSGFDTDLQTTMTKQDLAALPEITLDPAAPTPAPPETTAAP